MSKHAVVLTVRVPIEDYVILVSKAQESGISINQFALAAIKKAKVMSPNPNKKIGIRGPKSKFRKKPE